MPKVLNTYHIYPDIENIGAAFMAVLTLDGGTYAVYSGIVVLPPVGDTTYPLVRDIKARLVAFRGDKERFARAVTFYPFLKEEEYRA